MTKKELEFLEKVFAQEIQGRVFQGKNKTLTKLESEGYIVKRKIYVSRFIPITIEGYVLTWEGNYAYCSSLK